VSPLDIEVRGGQWFVFEDANGVGYAEADCVLRVASIRLVLLFECKRTHSDVGLVQLGHLYKPLLEFLFPEDRVFGLLVCQNLDPRQNRRFLLGDVGDWLDVIEGAFISGETGAVPLYSICWRG
jgi:hypothetical protein